MATQVQKLLGDKLERDLGRPISSGGDSDSSRVSKQPAGAGAAAGATTSEGNIVPLELDQVSYHAADVVDGWRLLSFVWGGEAGVDRPQVLTKRWLVRLLVY